MAKLTLADIASGHGQIDTINANNALVEQAINDQVAFRDLPSGETAPMQDDLDMNAQRLLNLPSPSNDSEAATKGYIDALIASQSGVISSTQVEAQTASGGETLINLDSVTYTPGGNNLDVYINGVHQDLSAYTESSTTSVTFSAALENGDALFFKSNARTNDSSTFAAANTTVTPAGTAAVTDVQSEIQRLGGIKYNIESYGAATGGTASDNTTAIHAAIAAAHANGGGIVQVPAGNYAVEDVKFDNVDNVYLEGESPGYNYGNAKSVSRFTSTSGTWCVRIMDNTTFCGMKNISLHSNGELNSSAPHVVITDGVEYGLLIEAGFTVIEDCSVFAFQYGCVCANATNSNVFERCGFVWNTRCGFAATTGSAGAYAAYHPNLVAPDTLITGTIFTMSNCNIRRNGWGMILRDTNGTYNNVLVESNFFGGLYAYDGTLDGTVSGKFNQCYLENNWPDYDTSVTYTITQNNMLQETAGVWIPWTTGTSDTTTDDAGYQINMGSVATGTNAGPRQMWFRNLSVVLSTVPTTSTKAMWLKSSALITFEGGAVSGGDQTNAVRLNAGTGGWYANQTAFYDAFSWPAPVGDVYGNRSFRVDHERSHTGGGGLTITGGAFQGHLRFLAAQVASTDVNTLDDYEESDSYTPVVTGFSADPSAMVGLYTKIGRLVTASVHMPNNGTSNTTGFTVTLPFAAAFTQIAAAVGRGIDNGTSDVCFIATTAGSAVATLLYGPTGTTWTGSGTKSGSFTISYPANNTAHS